MLGIFFGCTTRSDEKLSGNLKELLKKAGVEYKALGVELCCGAPLVLAGHRDAAINQAKKVEKEIEDAGVDEIATPCPHCFTMLGKEYEELLGHKLPVKVMHITQLIDRLIADGKLKLTKEIKVKISYHDPCYIGRQSGGIYDEPRRIVKSIPGVEYIEPELSRENATCCGGGGLLRAYLPNLAVQVAAEKIEMQLKPIGAEAVVSSCPFCYTNFADGAEIAKDFKVYDLIELVLMAAE